MATNDQDGGSVFAQYIENPKPERIELEIIRMGPATATIPPAGPKAHPTEKFLDWLINHWNKPTISLREICRHAPNVARDWESATSLSKILVERGWLTPIKTRRRDMRIWQILRGPSR